jgi:hypothetical protein
MKKSRLVAVFCVPLLTHIFCVGQSQATTYINSNFTMIDPSGYTFGGTNDITATWDNTLNTSVTDTNFNLTMGSVSDYPFFGFPPDYHHSRVFGPGNYSFDTTCITSQIQAGTADCGGMPSDYLDLTVGPGQIGAHILMNWNVTQNIDIVVLWDLNGVFDSSLLYLGPAFPSPATDTVYDLVSRDGDGDGIPGIRMIDGPFYGFSANYNLRTIPIPAATWLFGSGLLGLIGVARKKRKA